MNNDNSGAIVFLLAAILCVLLFGSSAVLTGLGWVAGIGAVLAVIFLVIAGIACLFRSLRDEVASARVERKPWLWLFVAWPATIGNVAVVALAVLYWLAGDVRFKDALDEIPYFWVPVTALFASMIVAAIESAHEWAPKVPGYIASTARTVPGKTISFIQGWLSLLVGPVLGPVGRWQTIREQRARGEHVGLVSAALSLFGAFLVGVLLWPLVLFPVGIVAIFIAEVSR